MAARADYKPLVTPLAAGSDPAAIARGYAALFTFPPLYVADLDGIEGRGAQRRPGGERHAAVPGARLLDRRRHAGREMPPGRIADEATRRSVIGSESLAAA